MSSVLNKIKNNVNKDFVRSIEKSLMEQIRFLPIMQKEETVFVAIDSESKKEDVISIAKSNNLGVKFIQLSTEEYDEFNNYITSEILDTPQDNLQNESQDKEENKPKNKKRLGEILMDKGWLTEAQLIEALAESKRQAIPLGSMLCKLNYVTIEQLKEALHEQQGFDLLDTKQIQIQEKIVNILPEDFIKSNKVIPISSNNGILIVGMVNPNDTKVLKDIVYLTGQNPRALMITHLEFQNYMDQIFSSKKKETKEIIQKLEQAANIELEETLWEQVEKDLQENSGDVAKFVSNIITNAIDAKASDIHIEPRLTKYVVRYRIDGILRVVLDIPAKVEQAVLTRFKVLARMDIAEHRRAQDGTFSIKYKDGMYDFRINTLPVSNKEKIVIRVLAPAVSLDAADRDFQLVGATDEDMLTIKKMVSCPNGIILTSGPTGSGKTTTLYSILKSLNSEDVNITTIEDPVEIKLEGINQSQVNVKAGITFASCMRAILRQDPDIILVGEIRDYETLEVAISAALTGHLVLSTVHTNSASATVTRLIEMGAKDYLVSSTVSGIIAQRLVRRLCDHCKEEYYPTREEAEQILTEEEDIEKFMKTKIYRAKGCKECDHMGYVGRLGVYEILPMNKEIKKLIAIGAHDIEIEETAIACGMKTLNQSCLNHILNGKTTIDEFIRVLGVVNE